MKSSIYAVIGVCFAQDKTFYVRRSLQMENYPGVWSLVSIQYDPTVITNMENLENISNIFNTMSDQRLGGVGIKVKSLLTTGESDKNPMNTNVILHLYEIEFESAPILNPLYYTDSAWLTAQEYEEYSAGQPCGLCLRLWSDYAWMRGITDRPFVVNK